MHFYKNYFMRGSLALLLLAIVGIFGTTSAQKIVMKITGVTGTNGESVKALEFKIDAETSYGVGGISVGKPVPGILLIKKDADTSSSEFIRKIVGGFHFPEVVFEYISIVNEKPVKTYIITLTEAFVTGFQLLTL
jgi:type VI protein secretion system component Hcp